MVNGIPIISNIIGVCNGCQLGKMTRQLFSKGLARRAIKILQLVHTDVCGPMRTHYLDNSKYFIFDYYSRMTWVYFMKDHSEVFKIFNKFKNYAEKECFSQIKNLRSDNGTEYTSSEFNKFCNEEGIHHQLTIPYTLQPNSVTERKNRTLMEMARSMLKDKGIHNKFWVEVVFTSMYLQNRLSKKGIEGRTPIKAWAGYKPFVSHLRVFGCICSYT